MRLCRVTKLLFIWQLNTTQQSGDCDVGSCWIDLHKAVKCCSIVPTLFLGHMKTYRTCIILSDIGCFSFFLLVFFLSLIWRKGRLWVSWSTFAGHQRFQQNICISTWKSRRSHSNSELLGRKCQSFKGHQCHLKWQHQDAFKPDITLAVISLPHSYTLPNNSAAVRSPKRYPCESFQRGTGWYWLVLTTHILFRRGSFSSPVAVNTNMAVWCTATSSRERSHAI